MSAFREAWDEAELGLVLLREGVVYYLNPAAARMIGAEVELAEGKPPVLALRHHRLARLLQRGGAEDLKLNGRILRAWGREGRLYLRDVSQSERRRRQLEEERHELMHELRTPVAGLAGLLELLQSDMPEAERRRALELARDEAERLLRLLAGQGRESREAWLVSELAPRLAHLLPGAARLRWDTPHPISHERDRVYQILVNLVENALKYGKPPIEVRTRTKDGRLLLEVADRGAPLADYQKIFIPGKRGVHAAGVRGSGLGLALVRRIARAWGGDAYAARVGEKNVFGVVLSRGVSEEEEKRAENFGVRTNEDNR